MATLPEDSSHPLTAGFCAACKPADRRPPCQWVEEHLTVDETSPFPGRWRSDASPRVRAVMEVFADNAVRDIAVHCAAQSAETESKFFTQWYTLDNNSFCDE